MGANSTRVTRVLVSNATAANTGTSAATAVAEDVILVDKIGVQLADTATLTSAPNAEIIRVLLGLGADGVEQSMPIQVRNVRKVTIQPYVAPTQHVVTVLGASVEAPEAGKAYSIKISHHDEKQIATHLSEEFYTYTAKTGDVAADVLAGLKAKMDTSLSSRVDATIVGADLVITGQAITSNAIEEYQYSYFHVSLRRGFTIDTMRGEDAMTITAGKVGNGHGQQVYDMERLSTQNAYTNYTSFPSEILLGGEKVRASRSGKYNIVTIEHDSERSGDLNTPYKAPVSTVVAFATADGTSSAKQTAFVEKLTSIVESAGVYVSDVVPSEV